MSELAARGNTTAGEREGYSRPASVQVVHFDEEVPMAVGSRATDSGHASSGGADRDTRSGSGRGIGSLRLMGPIADGDTGCDSGPDGDIGTCRTADKVKS